MSADANKPKVKDRIIAILSKSGKPMDFESIYTALCEDGYELPASKPKLVVRKNLYDTNTFTTQKGGLFSLADGAPPAAATSTTPPSSPNIPAKQETKEPEKKAAPPGKEEKKAVSPAPVQKVIPVATPLPASAPKPEQGPPAKPEPAGKKPKIKDRLVNILHSADRPLPFEQVYNLLTQDGWPLPDNKPKLVVRKALYDDKFFRIKDQAFSLAPGVKPTKQPDAPRTADVPPPAPTSEPSPAPIPASSQPSAAPPAGASAPITGVPTISADQIAAQAAQAAAEAAREAAKEAAREAAKEAAAQAASQAKATLEAAEAAKEAAIKAAREAAIEAAREAAREAAKEAAKEAAQAAAEAARRATEEAIATVRIPRPSAPAKEEPPSVSARSQGPSIRERAKNVILDAGRPLSFEEVFEALHGDGYPLPEAKPKEIVQRVLENENLFMKTPENLYVPYIEEEQELH